MVVSRKAYDSKTKESIHQSVRWFLGLVHPVLSEAASIVAARKVLAQFPSDSKDSKGDPLEARLAANSAQLKLIRSNLASMYGTKPVPFRLPISFGVTADAKQASGPCSGLAYISTFLQVSPKDAVEWPDMMALFDEYRVKRVHFTFQNFALSPEVQPTTGSNALLPDYTLTIGYDPSDGTPPSGARNVCELEQHRQYGTIIADNRVSSFSTKVACINYDVSRPLSFEAKIPAGVAISPESGSVTLGEGFWLPTATSISSPVINGYLKFYQQTGMTVVPAHCLAGVLYMDIEVRCRT